MVKQIMNVNSRGCGNKLLRNAYKIFVGKPQRKRPLADIFIDGRIILKCKIR
jgi:hypothetical protein